MADRQYAIKKIESLEVEDLTTALFDYNVPHDIIKIFANRDIDGKQLLKLSGGDVLQWRRQMRITEFNQVRKVVESIQQRPEDFVFKALKTSYKKPPVPPPNKYERQVESRKPIPQPRPEVGSLHLPLPPFTFPKHELTHDNNVVSSDIDIDGDFVDSNTQKQDCITNKDNVKVFQQSRAIATNETTFTSDQAAVQRENHSPRKGIYGHSIFNCNKPLPKIPTPINDSQSLHETKQKQARNEHVPPVKPKQKAPDVAVNNRTLNKTNVNKKEDIKGFLNVTSREANQIMKRYGSGAYLIRPSTIFHCTLVVKHEGHVYNVGIDYEPLEKLFKCASHKGFPTLLELIEYFKHHPLYLQKENGIDRIKVFLQEPVLGI